MLNDPGSFPLLIVAAAPREAAAVIQAAGLPPGELTLWRPVPLTPRMHLVLCGIGKVNAAACVARVLRDPYRAVLNVGVAGALPGSALEIGACVAASECVYADEGILTSQGFQDCGQMGFPMGLFSGRRVPVDGALLEALGALADRRAPVATVSTCSGTDAAALEVVARTGAVAEAMEGAAVAHVALHLGVRAGELRVISNTTGERTRQRWGLSDALERLKRVLGQAMASC